MKPSEKVQAHFELHKEQYSEFLKAVDRLGYASASEYLRQKVREAIREAQKTQ